MRRFHSSTLKKTWLSIAGAALIPLAAFGSTDVQSTIVQNGAPIAIDRCTVALENAGSGTNESFSEDVGFTNIGQQTATQVRFGFDIVDASGLTQRTVTGDKVGKFAPGSAINDSSETPASEYIRQTVSALPHAAKAFCRVQMVRFEDGSTWRDGDSPAGSAVIYTPVPGPSPTEQWQWQDPPTP